MPITVQARDEGLGVDYVTVHPLGADLETREHSCNGYAGSRCPNNWPVLFDLHADHFSEGIREVWISATDPTFKISLTYKAQTKVDRNPPQVTLDGQLAEVTEDDEGEQKGNEEIEKLRLPVYNLKVDAIDGNPNGAPEDKRSGVKDIRVFLDGAEQEVSWSAQGCSGPNFSCPMEKAYPLELSKLTSAGEHKLKVIVEDQVGNERERNIEFEYFPATGIKDSYVMHYFPLPDGQGNEEEEEHPRRPELAVNVMNGNLVYREQDIDVEGTAAVDLEVERYYNSQLPTSGNSEFGDGWTLAETPELEPVDTGGSPEPDEAQLLDASGAIEEDVELPIEAGTEKFDRALQATVEKKADGGYELRDETGESATSVAFDATGQTEALLTEGFAKVDYTYEGGELAKIAVVDPATVGVADPSELQIPEPPPFPPPSFSYAFGVSGEEEGEFDEPVDVAVGPQGDIWVVDAENNRIQHFGPYGEYLGEFGSYGTGSGQFRYPTAIEIDPEGNLWVLDSYNNRVQKFNQQGEFLAKWGSYGTAQGKLDTPSGLALDAEGNVWVSDTGNGRIQKFSPSGTALEVAGISGEGELNDPAGLDVGPGGEVFVADWAESHVVVFDTSGDYVRQFGSYGYGEGQLRHPDTVEVDTQGGVWVADEYDGELEHFDAEGDFIAQYGSEGEGEGEFDFNRPAGIVSDAEGGLWIADSGNDRVQLWTRDGYAPAYATAVGSSGTGNGQLDLPGDVDIDSEGDIWVLDTNNNRVQQFDPEGGFISKFGTLGSADGQLKRPSAIEIDAADNIWIADAGNDRVQKFNQAGQYLAKFGGSGTVEGKLDSPEGLAIDQSGDIWVADTWNDRVQSFSASGEFLKALGTSGEGELDEPMGLDVVFGEVFVADYEHDRIAVFDEAGNYLHEFGSYGYGLGQFRYPSSLEIDEGGNVWVGDEGNERILQFNIAGEFVTHFGSEGTGEGEFELVSPTGIATDAEGGIWVADSANDRLQRWEIPGYTPAPEPQLTDADPAVDVETEGGLIMSVEGNAAGEHAYAHTDDDLTAHDGPDGETEYEYDAAGRMTKVTLPNGTWGEIKYFSDGRVESVTVDPAGADPGKTTHFEYSDEPRRTFVEVAGEPNVTYDIGADGSVLKWWNTAQPPEIDDLAGSLYAARGKHGIEPGTYNLEAYAYSPEGIASIQFISNGDILIDEVTCEGKAAECEELANEWVTETGQHAPGILNVEVIVTDHDGNIESERFWVDIPVTPPEPHGALTPPKFKDVLRFRKDYGLEVVFPVANEFELNDRIFDLIGAWHNPHTPLGEVARASWERWGVPLRPADVAELEYRERYLAHNGPLIDQWGEGSHPTTYAGYFVDHPAGGTIRVGFTSSQMSRLAEIKSQLSLQASERLGPYQAAPTHALQTLDQAYLTLSAAVEGNSTLASSITDFTVEQDENTLRVGTTNIGTTEAILDEVLGSQAPVTVLHQPDKGIFISGRFRTSGRMRAGDGIYNAHRGLCTAGFGAYEDRERKSNTQKTRARPLRARFLLGAGHCYMLDEYVHRPSSADGAEPWSGVGEVTRNAYLESHPAYPTDALAIRVKSEGVVPRAIYGSSGHAVQVEKPAIAGLGTTLCYSGAKSGRVSCGPVSAVTSTPVSSTLDFGPTVKWIKGYRVKFNKLPVHSDSGSPVWNPRTKAAVGLAVAIFPKYGYATVAPLLEHPKLVTPGILNVPSMYDIKVITSN